MRESPSPPESIRVESLIRTLRDYIGDKVTIEDDWCSDEKILEVMETLEPNSSPGNPFSFVANNKQLLEKHSGALLSLVKQRLIGDLEAFPIRLFIKPEWHKKSKLDENRYRLIWQVSVVDQVIDKLLFGPYANAEVGKWMDHPSKVGWSYLNGGYKTVPLGWGYDRSAWDMSVPGWVLDTYEQYMHAQHRAPPLWHHWVSRRFRELYDEGCVLQLSDGTILRQNIRGIQKSGAYLTLSGNSVMQVILHHAASLEAGIEPTELHALGDDTMQPEVGEAYLRKLSQWVVIKEATENEFCGMHYGRDFIEPVYQDKHILNLCSAPTRDLLWSYQLLYARSSKYDSLLRLIEMLGEVPAHQLWVDTIWG